MAETPKAYSTYVWRKGKGRRQEGKSEWEGDE
jgi:hypothetical protein